MKQGDYFSQTIGPYDMWAIEYGYKPLKGGSPEGELPELKKIAARSGDPRYAFGDDGNARGIDPDPLTVRYDLSNDVVEYAKAEGEAGGRELAEDRRRTDQGRRRLSEGPPGVQHAAGTAWRSDVRGVAVRRRPERQPQPQGRRESAASRSWWCPPKKQREALELVEEQVFSDKPFGFPPELYGYLAASQWDHWGVEPIERTDYPAHDVILMWQDRILSKLLSPLTLARIHDSELKVPEDEDVLTTAELLESLTEFDLRRDGRLQGGRIHRAQAGDLQPAAESAAGVSGAALAAGDGPDDRAGGLRDGRLRRAQGPQGQDRHDHSPATSSSTPTAAPISKNRRRRSTKCSTRRWSSGRKIDVARLESRSQA